MGLAAHYGFEDYAQPACGCRFLTDRQYSLKLSDLWQTRGERDYELNDIMLLKVGRHLRPRPYFKLILGREEGENRYLEGYRRRFVHMIPVSHLGPLILLDGEAGADDLELVARFSKGRDAAEVTIAVTGKDGAVWKYTVSPCQQHRSRRSGIYEQRDR